MRMRIAVVPKNVVELACRGTGRMAAHQLTHLGLGYRSLFEAVCDPNSKILEWRPVDMVLHCPNCHEQHVDKADPETDWTNPPHKSHLCHDCGTVWRPADIPTNGVASIPSRGKADTWPKPPIVWAEKIEPEEVVFDRYGQWTHSAFAGEEMDGKSYPEHPAMADMEYVYMTMLLGESNFQQRPYDFRKCWVCGYHETADFAHHPSVAESHAFVSYPLPQGDGWFPIALGDDSETEDSIHPYVAFARPKQESTNGK